MHLVFQGVDARGNSSDEAFNTTHHPALEHQYGSHHLGFIDRGCCTRTTLVHLLSQRLEADADRDVSIKQE